MAGVRGACGRCDDGGKPGLSRGGRGRVRSAGGLSSGKKSPSCAVMSMRCGRVWTLRGDKSPLLPPLSGPAPGCRCPATGRADMMSESRSGNPYTLLRLDLVVIGCRVGNWRGSGRRMGVAVAGGFRHAGASLPAITPFPVTAHRTGRADFPHPALGRDHAFAHGRLAARGPRRVSPYPCHSLSSGKRT